MGGVDSRLDGSIVTARVGGRQIVFFVHNPADHIQHHHLSGIFYEQEELNIIAEYLKPHSTFVDIGANVGNHTIYAAKFLDARAVIPFEVNPEAIAILRANVALNQLQNVDLRFVGRGLASRDCMLSVADSDPNNLGKTQFSPGDVGAFPAIRGDSALSSIPVDFIKMDIEGMELEALAGLRETVLRWRPAIFAEIESNHHTQFASWRQQFGYEEVRQFARYADKVNYLVLPV